MEKKITLEEIDERLKEIDELMREADYIGSLTDAEYELYLKEQNKK